MGSHQIDTILNFREIIKQINKELFSKRIYDCEYMLINNEIEDVFHVLETESSLYLLVRDEEINGVSFKDYLEYYFLQVKRYYDALMIKEGKNDHIADKYFNKLTEPSDQIYPKSNIGLLPKDIQKTLLLMKEAVEAYYKVYHDKELVATLTTNDPDQDDYLLFQIKKKELLHLLGVSMYQLKNHPDFKRLGGKKDWTSEEILNWILQDIDGNQNLVQYQEDFIKKITSEKEFFIAQAQNSKEISTQLLNFCKIRSKSQTFLKYGPLEKVSLVAKLANGKTLSKNAKSDTAMITKADSFRKYPWAYFGSVQNSDTRYIETLQIDSSEHKKELFRGSQPAIIKKIGPIDGTDGEGIKIFSEDEQLRLFIEAYNAFSEVMNFTSLIEYFNQLSLNKSSSSRR